MRKNHVLTVTLLLLMALLSSCAMDASITNMISAKPTGAILQKGSLSNFTAMSSQEISTTGFARVSASGGAITYGPVVEEVPGPDYRFYHHEQGVFISKEIEP